ncbi:type II toxin-antitoxin system death-on-curing family toxin [uncultured Sphingomonas sp.]|uniref:type II toxin-antitoxin system death-on-curing family toxin n=1 Tax=uncultured Sphingomonas sp. TaxID=158754 RepID=UPI0035CA543F
MSEEPTWITADDLIALNRSIVIDTGEPFHVVQPGLLEQSALSPVNVAYYRGVEDVVVLGCTLAMSIARNHCFQQGNKRTAQVALFRFLWINGYTFIDPDDLDLAELMISLVDHAVTDDEYIASIGRLVIERVD